MFLSSLIPFCKVIFSVIFGFLMLLVAISTYCIVFSLVIGALSMPGIFVFYIAHLLGWIS